MWENWEIRENPHRAARKGLDLRIKPRFGTARKIARAAKFPDWAAVSLAGYVAAPAPVFED
jgi:hypothetical protein